MKLERTKNATKNILYGTILRMYQTILPFFIRTAFIYTLGVDYLGLNSLFTSIFQVLNLVELGVGSAMVFSMYKPIIDDDDKKICALMNLYKVYYRVIGTIIFIIGIIICPFITYFIKNDYPPINIYVIYILNLLTTVFSYWLFAYKSSILQAYQRQDIISKILIIVNTISYALQFVVLLVFKNYYVYAIILMLAQVLNNLMILYTTNKIYPQYKPKGNLEKNEKNEINQRVKDLFTTKIATVLLTSADTIVISKFLGLTTLAIYQNYFYIITAVQSFITIIFSSIIAGIGNSLIEETIDKNYNDLKKLTFIISFIIAICCNCFMGLFQPFIKLWVGEEFLLNYVYVILFTIYFYVCEISLIWATIKDSAGLWHEDRFRPLVGIIVNLVLNIILVQYIGLYGIVLSTIISYVLVSMPWLLMNIFKYIYKRNIKEYILQLIKYVVFTSISCLIAYCIEVKLPIYNDFIKIIVNGIVSVIIPTVIFIVFFRNTVEFDYLKNFIKNMMRKVYGKNKIV